MAKEKVQKNELSETIATLKKDYDENLISYAVEDVGNLGVIPFGILSVDKITGIGGAPKGRITELHGMDGTFKSTLTLLLVKSCQEQGGTCVYIDAEYAFSPEYAEQLGVDLEKLILVHPASAEEAFMVIEKFTDTNQVDLIVLDSSTALSPTTELNNEFGASNMGVMARLTGQFFRKITAKIGKSGTALIIIQQLREMLGSYVPMKVTPGGNAIKFYASLRLEIGKSVIKEDKDITGVTLKIKCIKNKLATPFLTTEVEAIYGEGINYIKDVLNLAISQEIIKRAGAGWMTYKDIKVQGFDAFKQLLIDNEGLLDEIKEQIK